MLNKIRKDDVMTIWYEVTLSIGFIEKVEVEKFTEKSVWVKKGYKYVRRYQRCDFYMEFYPTFPEAYKAARKHLLKRVSDAEEKFNNAKKNLNRLDCLEEEFVSGPYEYDTPLIVTTETLTEIEIEVKRKDTR